MNSVQLIQRLHQHRTWVNSKLLAAAGNLPLAALRAPQSIGQGSLWKSLLHMYAAEYVWLESLLGDESPLVPGDAPGKLPGNQEGKSPLVSLEDLAARWKQLDARWTSYLSGLTERELGDTVFKVTSTSGQRFATRRGDILLHVCTHAHYTTAQTMNMLRHAGVQNLPDPMLISLARQE